MVLCYLEGRTHEEAARQFGCPEGTLAARLARARTMLARRLARQGVVLSRGALAAVLSQESASACVPTSLLVATIHAASRYAAGQVASVGLISTEVAALTQGVLTAMFLSKLKVAMGVLLVAVVIVTGTGVLMSQGSGPDTQKQRPEAGPPDGAQKAAPKAESPKQDDMRRFWFFGFPEQKSQVSRPDGATKAVPMDKPAATVEVIWNIFQTNEALADEEFTGKRVVVTGELHRIRARDGNRRQMMNATGTMSVVGEAHV